jgi:predicted lipid-binding transport protein (Tim44 family)
MSSAVIQLLVLAGIAIFLILRLRSVLGTREGFEKPPLSSMGGSNEKRQNPRRDFEVIEGGPDRDITDYVEEGSDAAKALAEMKKVEPDFSVSDFLQGARSAYEMILMAFEQGDMEEVKPFLADDVYEAFAEVIRTREEEGFTVEANFVGIRDVAVVDAAFDREAQTGEITIRFTGELTSVVRNAEGEIVEGDPQSIRRQKDVWSFARAMGTGDPNWQLVATGE